MKLCKMIEIYLKYDNMHIIGTISAFICINNHINSCIKCMLSIILSPLSSLFSPLSLNDGEEHGCEKLSSMKSKSV